MSRRRIKTKPMRVGYQGEPPEILVWPAKSLKTRCRLAEPGDDLDIAAIRLVDAAKRHGGVGLAANQLGIDLRVCVLKLDDIWKVLVNPVLTPKAFDTYLVDELCLSFPGVQMRCMRPAAVTIHCRNENWESRVYKLKGLEAAMACHEIDHLDGDTMLDAAGLGPNTQRDVARRIKRGHRARMKAVEARAREENKKTLEAIEREG